MDCDVAGYHVGSFDYMSDEGLSKLVRDIPTEKFRLSSNTAVEFSYSNLKLGNPTLASCNVNLITFCICINQLI